MDTTRVGKKGQVSIPRAILSRLGIQAETVLLVEATDDGAIVLRPAGVYPVEIYSDARVSELLAEDRLSDQERERLNAALGAAKR